MPFALGAEVIKNETTSLRRPSFSFADVCKYMGQNETLLIDEIGPGNLDCMGQKINLNDFCQKKEKSLELGHENLALARGIIDSLSQNVICEKAKTVSFSFKCRPKDLNDLCLSASFGCEKVQKLYAVNLEISHRSLIEQEQGKILSCYFVSKIDEDLAKIIK